MISELTIKNFAIIDYLHVIFSEGFNVISGETGAGKTIIIQALNLLQGKRASIEMIKNGCEQAIVEAIFLPQNNSVWSEIKAALIQEGFDLDDSLHIKRIIGRDGKNKIFLNGLNATLSILERIGSQLVDISSQHEHQKLLCPESHIKLLDFFCNTDLTEYTKNFTSFKDLVEKRENLKRLISEKSNLFNYYKEFFNDLNSLNYSTGELENLKKEREIATNLVKITENLNNSLSIICNEDNNVLALLKRASAFLVKIEAFDSKLSEANSCITELLIKLNELSTDLNNFYSGLDNDPTRLETIEQRFSAINSILRKYNLKEDELVGKTDELRITISNFENHEEKLKEIDASIEAIVDNLIKNINELSRLRLAGSLELNKLMTDELISLGMKQVVFQVKLSRPEELSKENLERMISSKGIDQVEFLFSPNPGSELKSVHKIASGGELSRLYLALKKLIKNRINTDLLIFDEIDTGISGGIAEVIGNKLKDLSQINQLICITHHAQIACQSNTHFLVEKNFDNGKTNTLVRNLTTKERIDEIARMIGGLNITPKTVEHAIEMLQTYKVRGI